MALQHKNEWMSKNLRASLVMISQFLKSLIREQSLEIQNMTKPREHWFVALSLTLLSLGCRYCMK